MLSVDKISLLPNRIAINTISSGIAALASYRLTKVQAEISTTLIQGFSLPHNKIRIPACHISMLWYSWILDWVEAN